MTRLLQSSSCRALARSISAPHEWARQGRAPSLSRTLHTGPVSAIGLPNQTNVSDQQPTAIAQTSDASFEVLGSPFSLLSVKLSPSQTLHTRRGTLLGLTGNPENALSTLSIISPLQRIVAAIPFLYQRITSTSPLTAIIGTNAASSTITTIHLDGRTDWIVAQRAALLAWTGASLVVRPKLNFKMNLTHWGNTHLTGRGLVSLVGKGQVYEINLSAGEDYVLHPNHVLAYSVNSSAPQPYRFRSTALRLQVPAISSFLPDTKFFREMSKTSTWRTIAQVAYTLRTWARRSIWGDRLFLRFQGPATILVQSRAGRIRDSLSSQEVNDIVDSPAGVLRSVENTTKAVTGSATSSTETSLSSPRPEVPASTQSTEMKHAVVSPSGKVTIR